MANKITAPGENTNAGNTTKATKRIQASPSVMPENYINPFDDPEQNADGYPYVFSDIDFELKQAPNKFDGFDKLDEEISKLDKNSKSQNERIWQYKRWKTWLYLENTPKVPVVMIRGDNEKEDARGTVQINAVTYYILKGVEVYVPSDVKEQILNSQNQTSIAGRQNLIASLARKLDPVTGLPKDPNRLER